MDRYARSAAEVAGTVALGDGGGRREAYGLEAGELLVGGRGGPWERVSGVRPRLRARCRRCCCSSATCNVLPV